MKNESSHLKVPAHELVYQNLRERILFGEIAPGQAVTIKGLTKELHAGMTPVREAIRRLSAAGALTFQGNRRVIVPVLSEENLTELNFLREKLEPKLIMLATKRATPADIEGLREIDLELDRAITSGDINAYLRQNYQFHKTLYKLADAPILEQIADILWLLYGPSLRVVCGRIGTLNLTDQHKETLNAMSEGDGQSAADAIRADVTQGIDQIRHSMLNS